MESSNEQRRGVGYDSDLLSCESLYLPSLFISKEDSSFTKITFTIQNGFYYPDMPEEAGDLWSLWALPRQFEDLARKLDVSECNILTSFAISYEGKEASPSVDFCLMWGELEKVGISGLQKLKSRCFINSTDTLTTGFIHLEQEPSPEKMYLAACVAKAHSRIFFRGPHVTWLKAPQVGGVPYVLHISSCKIDDFILRTEGWVRDVSRPGLPVRLALLLDGMERNRCLARTPGSVDDSSIPPGAYQFDVSCFVPECPHNQKVELAVLGENEGYSHITKLSGMTETASPQKGLPSKLVLPDAAIIGVIDKATREGISGWALNCSDSETTVDLQLFIDNKPFSYTQCTTPRQDVQMKYGGNAFSGFHFELPPSIAPVAPVPFRVEACRGKANIKRATGKIKGAPTPSMCSTITVDRTYKVIPGQHASKKISVVIVNKNGAAILDEMLRSAEHVNDYKGIEWIVVDHQSNDDSAQVCLDARMRGFDLHFFQRNGNFSFSDSNNYGVRHSNGEIVIFANNDLLFVEPFSKKVCDYLSDSQIGALGVKLLDHIPDATDQENLPIQHLGVFFNASQIKSCIRPYEARLVEEIKGAECLPMVVPCATAAFMAMRRKDFDQIEGFDEKYIYGLEDVDLCLKIRKYLSKSILCANDTALIHRRGFSRKHSSHAVIARNNNKQLNKTWASYLRKNIRGDIFSAPGFWTGSRPVIGFIVNDAGSATSAGEYYTALELGRALQKRLPVHLCFITKKHWYDLRGVDVLIVMVKPFDISKVKNCGPFLLTINWMRQWFDAWAEDPTLYAYDYLFASSQKAADYITEKTGRTVDILRIATNAEKFASGTFSKKFACDYCFTGSFFKLAREIQFQLYPGEIKGEGVVYGHNWEKTALGPISKGVVPYSLLPNVYASTKIVIDDANIATKPWGSCNSRVFDSLAADCLLVTNGADGVQEIFDDLVPTFHDKDSLGQTINYWLEHEEERRERVKRLREIVLAEHTYDNRAQQFIDVMERQAPPLRIAIKCPAVYSERAHWGDYHFANALAVELRKKGHVVRIDCREAWNCGIASTDNVALVLRGKLAYTPKMHQKNIMWLISHPDDVSIAELLEYDHVYCASSYHAELLSISSGTSVTYLPQCVDPNRFCFIPERVNTKPDRILFVGNSRGIFRESVRWAVEQDIDISVYGDGWESFLKDHRLKGRLIPNEVLAEAYASSKYVLCDHWEDMKRLGYVSNRVFDVLAVGGRILVDDVRGLNELVPSGYVVFDCAEKYKTAVTSHVHLNIAERKALAKWVVDRHSFAARAGNIDKLILSWL